MTIQRFIIINTFYAVISICFGVSYLKKPWSVYIFFFFLKMSLSHKSLEKVAKSFGTRLNIFKVSRQS